MKSRLHLAASLGLFGLISVSEVLADTPSSQPFVRVSPRDARYFELSDGKPYIPIGLNMIAPPGRDEKQALARWTTGCTSSRPTAATTSACG